MQLSTILGAVALLASSAMASPHVVPRQHNPTTADVTNFTATRNGTHINYSADIKVRDFDMKAPAHLTHATPGNKVPDLSDMWDSSDPRLYLRFHHAPSSTGGPDRIRLVLSDVHKTGSTVNLDYFSPVEEWEGKSRAVYIGPGNFVMKV